MVTIFKKRLRKLEPKIRSSLLISFYFYVGSHEDGRSIERAIQCTKVRDVS